MMTIQENSSCVSIKAGIIGLMGYAGIELLRLLSNHPNVSITYAYSESCKGQNVSDILPHLNHRIRLICEELDLDLISKRCDMVFIVKRQGQAKTIAEYLIKRGVKVIDLGPDFRLKNPKDYKEYYHLEPAKKSLLAQAVYGLPEQGPKDKIATAKLVANPGCYATASLLATLPALNAKLIHDNECIFDAKSGLSGAGRTLSLPTHFCEAMNNCSPYQLPNYHKHVPEIEQQLSITSDKKIIIQFTPQLIPVVRGILVTAYFKLNQAISPNEAQSIYASYYQNQPFIKLSTLNQSPEIKQVVGSNFCHLGIYVDNRTQRLIVISVIDNLIKGAAGQAIQNMNLMYQLPETSGLLYAQTLCP